MMKKAAHLMMNKFNFTVLTSIFFTFLYIGNTNAYDDFFTPDEIFSEYSNENNKSSVLFYFNGLGSGIIWANNYAKFTGREPLFCRPADLSYGPEDFFRIWRQSYFRNQEKYDSLPQQPAGYILLKGLIFENPCN